MKKLDVLYAINNKFIDISLGSILSLITNSNIEKININIITENFKEEDYNKIREFLSIFLNVTLEFYPLEEFNIKKYKLPDWRNTQVANARLFFQDILKEKDDIENLLYLDADTVVISDLTELFEYDKETLCAVKEACRKERCQRFNTDSYYNSGVLYINMNQWIEKECQTSLIEEIKNNSQKLIYPDQDIINYALNKTITPLPLEYNLTPYAYLFNHLGNKLYFNTKIRNVSAKEIEEALKNPKILHSLGLFNIKAWSNNNINPFNDYFMEYLLQVDPNFQKTELNTLQKLININPNLLKFLLLVKNYVPSNFNKALEKTSQRFQGNAYQKSK